MWSVFVLCMCVCVGGGVRIKAVLDFTLLQKLTNNMKNVSQKGEGLTV